MSEKWRIMVVDDDDEIRHLLTTTLSTKYEVVEASNGLDALTKIDLVEPDLIIMDVKMPLMNGYQACEAIRRNPKYEKINVMFLSGMDDKDHIKKGYESGGYLYLTKPIEPMRLLKNVDLYFEENPPPHQKKLFTIEELRQKLETLSRETREKPVEAEISKASPIKPSKRPVKPEAIVRKSLDSYPELERPRVMVIDDDPDVVSLVRLSLQGRAEVVWATDSAAAIEKIARYEPDLLLLDIMMPKFSGFQLLQVIRRNPIFKDMPIVIVSAKSSAKDKEYATRIGADKYLTKPFSPQDLIDTLEHFTRIGKFKIRRKKLSYDTIIEMESKLGVEEMEDLKFLKRGERRSELEEFIRREMMDKDET